jgi:hypothetical protein
MSCTSFLRHGIREIKLAGSEPGDRRAGCLKTISPTIAISHRPGKTESVAMARTKHAAGHGTCITIVWI